MACARQFDVKRFHHLYRHEYPCGPDTCVYCGDPASSEDHVVPLSYLGKLGTLLEREKPRLRRGLVIVPACLPCNSMLSGFFALSVCEKRKELKRRLRSKYARLLGAAEWSDDELEGLGPSLRGFIEALDRKARSLWLRYTYQGEPRAW